MDVNNDIKMMERANKFTNYEIVDKIIPTHKRACVTMMKDRDIKFTQMIDHEDDVHPMIHIKIKEKKGKHLVVLVVKQEPILVME